MSSPGGYDPKQFESAIYAAWEAAGHFHAEPDPSRQPFVITIPPPNVTGALHLGHALNNTLQDILIRRKRMQGFNVCWLPGTDHAGIATQAVVEKRLREEQGLSRREIGREGLVKKIWEWKEEYNTRILNQLRRMGCSCDWPRTRFTLDEQCAKAVYETFFRFFKDGLIYRGLRLVNWDTQLQTAVADDEVEHKTVKTNLWHIRYPILPNDDPSWGEINAAVARAASPDAVSGRDFLSVATTRPETMLADTAVAVHPDDERFNGLVGRAALLPVAARPIPIIADGMLVKREFGTGCVKVTPGHDPNDYACWQRHLGRPDQIRITDLLTVDGRIRDEFGAIDGPLKKYGGMRREEARKAIVADLESAGLMEKIEPYETEVGHSDRSKTPIEPLRSEQWFVKMDKPGRPRLADLAMEAVRDCRVRFFPERYAKTYLDWLGEKRDWCISRQLWWGHRIPVWSAGFSNASLKPFTTPFDDIPARYESLIAQLSKCLIDLERITGLRDEYYIQSSPEKPSGCLICARTRAGQEQLVELEQHLIRAVHVAIGGPDPDFRWIARSDPRYEVAERIHELLGNAGLTQDPDVLDTWFSSALWPHGTFGWPHDNAAIRARSASEGVAGGSRAPLACASGSDSGPTDLDYFYPTSVLSTAREIITLWVARMVLTGLYNVGRVPFQHVYIHPVIQDGQGRPMKKSLGNGVDPLDIIDAYGADALRYTLAQLTTETQDIRIPVKAAQLPDGRTVNTSERFELGRNLVTKLWQATTGLVIPTLKADPPLRIEPAGAAAKDPAARDWHTIPAEVPPFEQWIRVELLKCIREVDTRLDRFEFSAAVEAIRNFFWGEFCDWYVEFVKVSRDLGADPRAINQMKITLLQALDTVLALFHPAMPFVTEALWTEIGREFPRHHELIWPHGQQSPATAPALIVAPWPRCDGEDWLRQVAETEKHASARVHVLKSVCVALREIRNSLNNIRSAAKQSALRNLPSAVIRCNTTNAAALREAEPYLTRLGQVEKGGLTISPDATKPPQSMSRVLTVAGGAAATQTIEIYVPIAGLADLDVERKRLAKDRDESAAALQRLEAKLANEGFIAKAKPEVIEAERARLVELKEKLAAIERNLAELG